MTGGDEERGSRRRAMAAAKAKGPAVPVVDKPESSTRKTTSALATSVGGGKEPTPGTDASLFQGKSEADHVALRKKNKEGLEDPQTDKPQPPPVAGRAVAGIANMLADALDEAVDAGGAAEGGGGEEGQGSTARTISLRQTTMRRWVDNVAQKKLDIAWAEATFRAGIAFNFLNMDRTQTLHAVSLEVANARPKVKLPSYNYMRTIMLDIIYLKIQKEVNPMTRCWDSTGCTFITDGSIERKSRPVMNFLAAGEQGVVLVTTVTMSGRKKNAVALAKLWEQVTREIGLQRINAICTDNAEVNKKAAQILERRKDKDVARILWVPCGAHCCSLLLKDLANLLWIKGTVITANTIIKFIRNHHATHDLMMTVDDSLSLLHREDVIVTMVDGRAASKWRALRWLGKKLRRRADLVYYTVRSEAWWPQVRKIVDIMHPIFQLLKRMDAEGTPPTNLVEYDDMIRRKLTNVVLMQKEREDVMEKIGGEWNSEEHSDLWAELMEFQKESARVATEQVCTEPGKAMKKRKDEQMWKQPVVDMDVPTLQAIAIKVMGMWSTATPAEHNWASMDFVHTKRRNSLSPTSLEKLVYIHWNMQLLRARHHKDSGFVDVWGSFFEPIMEPKQNDGLTLATDTQDAAEKEDEETRQRNMAKAPKNRIPQNLLDSDTSDSSDLEDTVWKGKCWNESSSEDCGEDEDSDFELSVVPAVPATTYVGRRTRPQDGELELEPKPVVERVDTDVEFLLHRYDDPDEEPVRRRWRTRIVNLWRGGSLRRRPVVQRSLHAGRARGMPHNRKSAGAGP
ncbi:hypothetical protein CBR_g34910 [Chara braunii]|uniref:DUF659 domain-containing protein n=1 Tax=Chara braunii TaxID=69332 RepID=A0A388LJM9_CHABU|nr:hypothetical protein CBR_g34910 [Chara braunii]|eukprot:GBG82534.1 hypothetical protein CBR_g34910 [Chara braunii]